MGVAKTKKNLLFSIPGSSRFIYTPTKKVLKIKQLFNPKPQQNPHFSPIYSQNLNIAPNIVKPHKNQHFLPLRNPQSQTTIQITFFLYKYKIIGKIHIFTDYQFRTKFTYKSTSNPHQFFYISYLKIIILHNTINNHIKHLLPGIIRLNQRN